MTPVLVLGGTGMLGHVLWRTCRDQGMEVFATVREERGLAPSVLDPSRTITGVSVEEPDSVARALDESGAAVGQLHRHRQAAPDEGPGPPIRSTRCSRTSWPPPAVSARSG